MDLAYKNLETRRQNAVKTTIRLKILLNSLYREVLN